MNTGKQAESWRALLGLSPLLTEYYRGPHIRKDDCVADESRITYPQIRLVTLVARFDPEGIRVGDIARLTGMTPGAASKIVDRLVQEDLVQRIPDPCDRRAAAVVLTEKARTSWNNQLDWTETFCMEVLQKRPSSELKLFFEIINELYGRLCKEIDGREQEGRSHGK